MIFKVQETVSLSMFQTFPCFDRSQVRVFLMLSYNPSIGFSIGNFWSPWTRLVVNGLSLTVIVPNRLYCLRFRMKSESNVFE